MDFQQFMQATNGKAVTYDGLKENYGQCEQLVCLYWRDVYGFNCPMIPDAKDLITNPAVLVAFDVIPVGQEQARDVAVFGASTVINSPVAGHTDIVISPTTGGFLGWDSNWGGVTDQNQGTPGYGYPAAHQVQHNHVDVIGFLRFKGESMDFNQQDVVDVYALFGQTPTQEQITAEMKQGRLSDVVKSVQQDAQRALAALRKPQLNELRLMYQLGFGPNTLQPSQAQLDAQMGQPDLSHAMTAIQADSAKAWAAALSDGKPLTPGKYIVS